MKHLSMYLSAPAMFALAFVLGGTPNAPISGIVPQVGGIACASPVPPGAENPFPCSYTYDSSSDGFSWIGQWFDMTVADSNGCADCGYLAEQKEIHEGLALAMGLVALATTAVPTLAMIASIGASGNLIKGWYYGRVARLSGC